MIGVIADDNQRGVVEEFFELFKVPWEFYRDALRYDVVLCSTDEVPAIAGAVMLLYGSAELNFDREKKIQAASQRNNVVRQCGGMQIPIYGDSLCFQTDHAGEVSEEDLLCRCYEGNQILVRVGYDLFEEIETLLTKGQPAAYAALPTLELHIALLRDLILGTGVPLVEIPPVPSGYEFTACLTHDVDHPSIRRHRWDHTAAGFLYRALAGSLLNALRGRMTVRNLLKNWMAAVRLPLVHLGLAKDFWEQSLLDYVAVEGDLPSTFFFIPFGDCAGDTRQGAAPGHRAAKYGAADVASQITALRKAGREVGLHGLNAWLDSSRGEKELEEIARVTGSQETGVRMHWLYFDQESPVALERAGAAYDSTVGYNETVGYRAGTTQVYKPLGADQLLELPLHLMDTALFFPGYLHCSDEQASARIDCIIDQATRLGGVVTVNWHDRSLAPERLWGGCYGRTLRAMRSRGAWFATAGDAVSWFRKRRSARFDDVRWEAGLLRATVTVDGSDALPDLRLRVHHSGKSEDFLISSSTFACAIDTCLHLQPAEAAQETRELAPSAPGK
jgi:hypothetical protein